MVGCGVKDRACQGKVVLWLHVVFAVLFALLAVKMLMAESPDWGDVATRVLLALLCLAQAWFICVVVCQKGAEGEPAGGTAASGGESGEG